MGVRIRELLLLLFLSMGLPTIDGGFDLYLSITAIQGGRIRWGIALLVPVIVNLCCKGVTWWRMDTREERRWTWILVVLMLWPQYRALVLFWRIVVKGKEEGLVEKQVYGRRVKDLEPLVEAIPQVRLAWTFWIMVQTFMCRCL